MNFKDWLQTEAARRSFAHTLGKFWGRPDRPIAVLTAFRKIYDLDTNRNANQKLEKMFKRYGLSSYPVIGAGQERDAEGKEGVSKEESYIVSPIGDMPEDEFLKIIRHLLIDPTGENDIKFAQDSAVVKLPSQKKAFLLGHEKEGGPETPEDYVPGFQLGASARPRRGKAGMVLDKGKEYPVEPDQYFTQMVYGPQASDTMKNDADADEIPGRRFTISRNKKF